MVSIRRKVDFRPTVERLVVAADSAVPAPVTPTRTPADPFAGKNASRLVESLGEVSRGLRDIFSVGLESIQRDTNIREAENQKAQRRAGAVAAAREAIDATAKGVITEGQNPFFLEGFRQQKGRIEARAHSIRVYEEYIKNPGIDVAGFLDAHRKQSLDLLQSDQARVTFLDRAERTEQGIRAQSIQFQANKLRVEKSNATFNEASIIVDSTIEEALGAEVEPYGLIADRIQNLIKSERVIGMQPQQIALAVRSAIIQSAIRHRDERLLNVLLEDTIDPVSNQIIPGTGKTREGRKAIIQARDAIRNLEYREEDRENKLEDRKLLEEQRAILQELAELVANGGELTKEAELDLIRRGVPNARARYNSLKKAQREIFGQQTTSGSLYHVQSGLNLNTIDQYDLLMAGTPEGLVLPNGIVIKLSDVDLARYLAIHNSQVQDDRRAVFASEQYQNALKELLAAYTPPANIPGLPDEDRFKFQKDIERQLITRFQDRFLERINGKERELADDDVALAKLANEVRAEVQKEFPTRAEVYNNPAFSTALPPSKTSGKERVSSRDEPLNPAANPSFKTTKALRAAVNEFFKNRGGPLAYLKDRPLSELQQFIQLEARRLFRADAEKKAAVRIEKKAEKPSAKPIPKPNGG